MICCYCELNFSIISAFPHGAGLLSRFSQVPGYKGLVMGKNPDYGKSGKWRTSHTPQNFRQDDEEEILYFLKIQVKAYIHC